MSINRDMSQINSELIYLLDSDSNIKEIPDQITSTDAQYYEMEQTLRERNRVLKIRYHEVQTFFVYGQKANVLITDSGTMFTESKGMTTLNQMLMSYLQIMTSKDSISTQWTVITFGDDDYIVGWYAKNKKVIGCVINLNLIFRTIRAKTEEYDVIPFMVSDYMRYIFQDSKKQRDVEEELEHIEAYIRIQKLRYGEEAFSFEATMDGDIGEWKVPSLLLQTLVENSVVHGVSLDRKSEISLYLTNETYEDGEYLYICISDTGNGFSKEALDAIENDTPIIYHGRHHVGISNIKRRLALMYGERASITCSNMDENYGAVVEVRLPKTE